MLVCKDFIVRCNVGGLSLQRFPFFNGTFLGRWYPEEFHAKSMVLKRFAPTKYLPSEPFPLPFYSSNTKIFFKNHKNYLRPTSIFLNFLYNFFNLNWVIGGSYLWVMGG